MTTTVTPFLMFQGQAEEAMTFYVSLFEEAEIESLEKYDDDAGDAEGLVRLATFSLQGREFICIDSPVPQEFDFTPSMSIFITCEDESEIDELYAQLSDGGAVMMPLQPYDFSLKFGWITDRFGVSWQLNLQPTD